MVRRKTAEPSPIERTRHSLAHLLAAAILERYPTAKLAIGPPTKDGFYYDVEFPGEISERDLRPLERRMREFIAADLPFEQREISKTQARKMFAGNPYKREMIDELPGRTVGISTVGDFSDLCRGGHVERTSDIDPKAFTLRAIAGAYWRGSEKNPMLTRIYGAAFETKKELSAHLAARSEAKERDHKVLGPRLGLFFFHETAPGMPYWLPKGMIVLRELMAFWWEEHEKRGYHEVSTPLLNKKALWVTSGHWEHFRDAMFLSTTEKEVYGLKPMNCPNAMIVFQSALRSYKDLPLRIADMDVLHRSERSGTLNGLLRARAFRQDDAHIFVTDDQTEGEIGEILDLAETLTRVFELPYRLRLGTRPEKFLGDVKTWNAAEAALARVLDAKTGRGAYEVLDGDGAFYGPKIDILMSDALGREWQTGTIQLDVQQPKRFHLSYVDKDGAKKTPVVIHRVIYGSLDRFIGILIEHFGGVFPLWLAPVQVRILPVSVHALPYARTVQQACANARLRAEVDDGNETIGRKIRDGELQKIPVLAIVGERERKNATVTLRTHGGTSGGTHPLADAVAALRRASDERRLALTP